MNLVAIGFWGAYCGTAALMLVGAMAAFAQADRRVAQAAAATALVSVGYAALCLGWLPLLDPLTQAWLTAPASILASLVMWLLLLADLGRLRERRARLRIIPPAVAAAVLLIAVAAALAPRQAARYGALVAFLTGFASLPVALRSARRGDRAAWIGVAAIAALEVALACNVWIVGDPLGVPWPVHAVCATAGIAYLMSAGLMLWRRYSYLIELREVRALGPSYDPITRMQSNAATGAMVARALGHHQYPGRPVVLIAVSIANLYALENLHGRAALNHALFVCASRLRRCVPPEIEMARLFDDAFLLVSRSATDLAAPARLAQQLASRLAKPLTVPTSRGPGDAGQAPAEWAAQVGVGVLATAAAANPAAVVARVRGMSRAAWSFASRVAFRSDGSEAPDEVPSANSLV